MKGVASGLDHSLILTRTSSATAGMLNTINKAKLVALLIAVRHCRPRVKETVASDLKCSMQKIGMQLTSPSSTVDDRHIPLLKAIGHEIMQRAQAGG